MTRSLCRSGFPTRSSAFPTLPSTLRPANGTVSKECPQKVFKLLLLGQHIHSASTSFQARRYYSNTVVLFHISPYDARSLVSFMSSSSRVSGISKEPRWPDVAAKKVDSRCANLHPLFTTASLGLISTGIAEEEKMFPLRSGSRSFMVRTPALPFPAIQNFGRR